LLERGIVAARQQDWTTAESRFRAAARSAPDSPVPWQNLAKLYQLTGRPDDAAAATARATHLGG
jgi:Flp pilus assembly protein TadD